MHAAYNQYQLIKLPLTIECLVAFQGHLLVGTKQGHLLMYSVTSPDLSNESGRSSPQIQLLQTNKLFSKKSILRLRAVPDCSILLALTADGVISVHDLDGVKLPFICDVPKAKGATTFDLDLVRTRSLTGETSVVVRMVVAVRKKLLFFYWKNRKFLDLYPELNLNDIPRSIAWCSNSICVGFKGEYSLVKLDDENREEICELFPTGKNCDAAVTLLSDQRFALAKDDQTTFIDLDGNMKLYAVSWSEVPLAIAHDVPYLLGVVSNAVEVRTDRPRLSIQRIEFDKPRFITTCDRQPGWVYVASQSQIWGLKMVSTSEQIPLLLRNKQFELAVTLSSISNDLSLEDRSKRVQQIQTLYAFDLFCNFKFKESMDVFFQLDIDASHVIGLFPDLLPKEHKDKLIYPETPPVLQGRELENGLLALIQFLTQIRHRLNSLDPKVKVIKPLSIMGTCPEKQAKKRMLQIIETTLLKCYLRTNDALVAPLLRLKENNCHPEETERELRKCRKYSELVIFYNAKEMHRKALKLLKEHHDKADSPLKGHMKTVNYLQNLYPNNLDIIFEYSPWVFDINERDGLSIFTEDEGFHVTKDETEKRLLIFEFLKKTKVSTVIPYLKYLILERHETNPLLHNALLLRYKDFIMEKLTDEEIGKNESEAFPLTIKKAREELKELILSSRQYTAELVLSQFPSDCLEEERAMLLGNLKRHNEALCLFLYQLNDVEKAKKYCTDHYGQEKPDSEIYNMFFKLLLEPPNVSVLKHLSVQTTTTPKPDIDTALSVLKENGDKVDMILVLKHMPDSVPLQQLGGYLSSRMSERVSQRHHTQVLRGLMHAEHLRLQEERIALESRKVEVGEYDLCRVCHKRFKNQGAFVRLTSGEIVHYSCSDKV